MPRAPAPDTQRPSPTESAWAEPDWLGAGLNAGEPPLSPPPPVAAPSVTPAPTPARPQTAATARGVAPEGLPTRAGGATPHTTQGHSADDEGRNDHGVGDDSSGDEDFSSSSRFAHAPPFRPRRNPARLWTMAAAIFALVAFGAMAAVAKYGLPDWAPLSRSTFAAGPSDLVLDFPPSRQDRRTLPNGTEYFGVSGRITNMGKQRRAVPTLLIVLRDANNHIVYSWEVTPPKSVLAPGETIPVIEAVTDIPRAAKYAEIGWKRA